MKNKMLKRVYKIFLILKLILNIVSKTIQEIHIYKEQVNSLSSLEALKTYPQTNTPFLSKFKAIVTDWEQ